MKKFDSAMDLYRQMAANIPDCSIYIFDENYEYLLAEGEEIAKNGFSSEMLVGSNFFEVWPQEVTMELAAYYQDTLKGKRQKLEKQSETGYFIQHFIPIADKSGNVLAGMVVSQNISVLTETRQKLTDTSRELRTKDQLIEAVINTLAEGIIVSDKTGKVLLTNPATEKMLGVDVSTEDISEIGNQLIIKTSENGRELTNHEMPLAIALHGGMLNGYVTYVENRKSRKQLHVENNSRPIVNDDGEVEAALLVMRNISLRKELEDLVDENISTLKEKNERLEGLLYEIAKGMRGPVANIDILLSLIKKTTEEEERELYLSKMADTSRMLEKSVTALSTAIMAFTSVKEDWVQNNFDEILDEFRMEYRKELEEVDLTIKSNFRKAEVVIFPPNVLRGVIFNLLSNLLQFSAQGEKSEVVLTSSAQSSKISVKISCDINNLNLQRIFATGPGLFGQKSDFGLMGLFIAKNHIESLGGRIVVDGKKSLTLLF